MKLNKMRDIYKIISVDMVNGKPCPRYSRHIYDASNIEFIQKDVFVIYKKDDNLFIKMLENIEYEVLNMYLIKMGITNIKVDKDGVIFRKSDNTRFPFPTVHFDYRCIQLVQSPVFDDNYAIANVNSFEKISTEFDLTEEHRVDLSEMIIDKDVEYGMIPFTMEFTTHSSLVTDTIKEFSNEFVIKDEIEYSDNIDLFDSIIKHVSALLLNNDYINNLFSERVDSHIDFSSTAMDLFHTEEVIQKFTSIVYLDVKIYDRSIGLFILSPTIHGWGARLVVDHNRSVMVFTEAHTIITKNVQRFICKHINKKLAEIEINQSISNEDRVEVSSKTLTFQLHNLPPKFCGIDIDKHEILRILKDYSMYIETDYEYGDDM